MWRIKDRIMKKIIGIILLGLGILLFLSLYIFMVILKDSDIIGYVIFIVGFISLVSFITGVMLYQSSKQKNE